MPLTLHFKEWAGAVSDGQQGFHPAIYRNVGHFYWPTKAFATKAEALRYATLRLVECHQACDAVTREWPIKFERPR